MRRLVPLVALLLPRFAFAAEGSGNLVPVVGGLVLVLGACAALVFSRRVAGLLATAVAGAGASAYLTVQHYAANHGASSICNINATFNCDAVNTSAWSEVAGVPVALFGMGYFAAMAYLAWRRLTAEKPGSPAGLAVGAVLGSAASVFMAYQSAQLGVWCLFCISTYIANLLLLVGSVLELRASEGGFQGSAFVSEIGPAAAVGLAVFVVGVVVYQNQAKAGPVGAGGGGGDDVGAFYEQPRGKITLTGTEPFEGAAEAKYVAVEWADFECPHCAKMAPQLAEVVKENPDFKVYFKNYPISGDCNRFVQGQRHQFSCHAAAAGICAKQQGRFFDLAHAMFENQQYLADDDIKFMAREKGFDPDKLATCMADPATMEVVKADIEGGGAAQIDGTPSIFLHGLFGDDWVRLVGGKDELNAILKAARTGAALPKPRPPSDEE